jgi:parvulin-like peptidyl-prolyl isomerase
MWEACAIEEIRKWRFLPATQNGRPVSVWIRQSIIIRPEKLLKMSLSEIAYADRRGADSIYTLLKMGEDFDSLARTVSIAASRKQNGKLGDVDIRTFPFHIQKELAKLNVGEVTIPLQLGHSFIIFKRLAAETELQAK